MKNSIFALLMLCTTVLFAQNNTTQSTTSQSTYTHAPVVIGDEIPTNLQTAHPYNPSNQIGVVFEQEFYNKNSAYIKLYFENFDLGPEDYIEISTHNTGESIIYAGKGKIIDKEGTIISNFWSRVLLDERVTVRLHAQSASNHYGFKISKVAYGYSAARIDAIVNGTDKSICGADDKERIACYNGTIKATRGKAVCKLIIGGVGSCTGWLLGCEGHVMTNNHCVGNATDAGNTDFLFDYQYSACTGTSSLTATTVATSATFIKTSPYPSGLDYTLLKLPTNPTATYGYLSLSSVAPSVGDRIYIIGHPGGRRKEITVNSDQDASGFAQVNTLTTNGMRYYADTEGGSSGSPVLSNSSNLVYSIHNTGGCTNGSHGRCDKLIADIGSDMPNSGVDYSACSPSSGCLASVIALPSNQGFESSFGVWSNESNDDFDWARRTGSTPSSNTGPTSASEGSYYAYMEASYPNYGSKDAILNSPCYYVNVSNAYARFKYHMYGATTGTLRFQVSTNNGTSWTTLWSRTGDQGNSWKTASVNVSAYINTNGVRFRFHGTTGSSFTGDIAIDDISIYSLIFTKCINSYPYTEGWETGLGIWSQSATDDFDWTRRMGSTPSTSTGPTAAIEGNYYLYTESSYPNYGNKQAIITSRCFNLTSVNNPAASFRYHMYGSTMGTLQLQISVNSGSTWTTIWTRTGDQGNSWKYAYVNLNAYTSNTNVRLRFVGTTGSSYRSDMAIDAFGIHQGLIISPPVESIADDLAAEPFLTVSPNPFNSIVNINTNIEGLTNYRLINIQGQTVKEGLFQSNSIELGDLNKGVYFLALYNEEEQIVRKVIKQ
ncbi:trypsin-like peptidase domain-containing protein [Aureispira anguillae]|uniref:Trypsin-like peptidase domain-containing protein n=1 Tax=Aureispira anguillae TaxID=2864201 RepID=A0A915YGA0_9BACT|nr:trypsin-like peptidase domain-containing protein [Aureispira anguillae]BDS12423.1 trypsin-like peptidase domain-containing protein [Aureispira anguillae]